MIACGMCDLSPRLNTPIRTACFSSRLGLLATGTVDDPLSVSYSTSICRSHSTARLDIVDIIDDANSDRLDGQTVSANMKGTPAQTVTVGYDTETRDPLSSGRANIVTPAAIRAGKAANGRGLSDPSIVSSKTAENADSSIEWLKNDGKVTTKHRIPLTCTPAKKSRLSANMKRGLEMNQCDTNEKLDDSSGNKMASDMACSEERAEQRKLDVSNEVLLPITRWKPYRHKVLLKLRKKQASNNYDLALFLFIKFGGSDTSAGRSVMRDKALVECSVLNNCKSKEDFEICYRKEREKLMQILTQRIAVDTLSAVQLNRKLAKLLPPNKWFNHGRLQQKVSAQESWNPFSIFGSALPYVDVREVFKQDGGDNDNTYGNRISEENNHAKATETSKGCATGERDPNKQNRGPNGPEQCVNSVETTPGINWSGDPLVLDEVLWYLEATGKYVDKSKQALVLQKCFCVTPNPQIAFNWNDSRNPEWKNYRGPRASMGQALSPSMYEESMLDYTRLQGELGHIVGDRCCTSIRCSGQLRGSQERNSNPKPINMCTPQPNEMPSPRNAAHYASHSVSRSYTSNAVTPRKHSVKMQQLTYYRNYFEANRIASVPK